jgi:hypothetical protein
MSLPAMLKLVAPLWPPKNPSKKSLNFCSPPALPSGRAARQPGGGVKSVPSVQLAPSWS